jgi:hypothetical protein
MTLGWLVVAVVNGCVALSMAEICSAYPTSGGLYYWSAKLAGKKWAPLASWVTGWCVLNFDLHFSLLRCLPSCMVPCLVFWSYFEELSDLTWVGSLLQNIAVAF